MANRTRIPVWTLSLTRCETLLALSGTQLRHNQYYVLLVPSSSAVNGIDTGLYRDVTSINIRSLMKRGISRRMVMTVSTYASCYKFNGRIIAKCKSRWIDDQCRLPHFCAPLRKSLRLNQKMSLIQAEISPKVGEYMLLVFNSSTYLIFPFRIIWILQSFILEMRQGHKE